MFSKILIANRGEIACRVMRTARRLGVQTVAVYSDADAGALHVREADEAVHIGGSAVLESYLKADAVIDAAVTTGAEAIHPGYGFLSENAAFAEAVAAAGLTFIGPSAEAIRAMGLKDAAKAVMENAGVPVVPGYHGADQDLGVLRARAEEIGFPLLVKARAGGGGKGMRLVETLDDFDAALASAQREARSSFGDGAVLLEKYLAQARHIEVQVFGDAHGNVVHLFERDCSLQRRHQKVIEEAPAPAVTPEMRDEMGRAAVRAAEAIGYQGAGTIEFIVDATGGLSADGFYFMEMNTRLQVEHPVTEAVSGQDLVEWQLRVAAGERLIVAQDELAPEGWAMEARVYAENPAMGFLPSTGRLRHLSFPSDAPGVRVDAGVAEGDAVTSFYDPMIAKVIASGADREAARRRLLAALKRTEIVGLETNINFLVRALEAEAFTSGDVDTGLVDREAQSWAALPAPDADVLAAAAAGVFQSFDVADDDPWSVRSGWRLWGRDACVVSLEHDGTRQEVSVTPVDDSMVLRCESANGAADVTLLSDRLLVGGKKVSAVVDAASVSIFSDRGHFHFARPDLAASQAIAGDAGGDVRSPLPGLVKAIHVTAGESVAAGAAVAVVEAMKMEHTLVAAQDATVVEIAVAVGSQVSEGDLLISLAEAETQ